MLTILHTYCERFEKHNRKEVQFNVVMKKSSQRSCKSFNRRMFFRVFDTFLHLKSFKVTIGNLSKPLETILGN